MPTRPVIIDTDPGQDDAVALLMALAAPEAFKIVGVTTVGGNVPIELTTANAPCGPSANAAIGPTTSVRRSNAAPSLGSLRSGSTA